jgi:ribulose-phosphate 3-epimerase
MLRGRSVMKAKISPSLMCIDFKHMEREIRLLEKVGVDYMHMDIMDGHFVPNFTMGPDILKAVREMTDIPIDIHLMIEKPENYIDIFDPQPKDIVCVHQESTVHLQRVLQRIRDMGARPGVAINPATPLCMISHVLRDVEMVLIMTVNPGYAGQKLVPATLDKIREMREIIDTHHLNIEIEVDGNVSFENARKMRQAGADIFVAGSSSLFNRQLGIEAAGIKLKEAISD